ncbi:MAG: hypothetical protein V9E99_06545 [Microthrixaceae bacterium]
MPDTHITVPSAGVRTASMSSTAAPTAVTPGRRGGDLGGTSILDLACAAGDLEHALPGPPEHIGDIVGHAAAKARPHEWRQATPERRGVVVEAVGERVVGDEP